MSPDDRLFLFFTMAVYPEEEMQQIRTQPWFHGSITRSLAEHRLEDASDGTYLFRESETRPGFSLSLKVPGRVKHFMISKKESGLWYLVGKQKEFDTIFTLIEYHTNTETNSSDHTCLTYPCPVNVDENPYVQMNDDVTVNAQAMAEVKAKVEHAKLTAQNESAARRASQSTSGGAKAKPSKANRYEFVKPGGLAE